MGDVIPFPGVTPEVHREPEDMIPDTLYDKLAEVQAACDDVELSITKQDVAERLATIKRLTGQLPNGV